MKIEGMDDYVIQQNLADVVDDLREQRVKKGTDYNYTLKYRVLHVMCNELYKETIKAVFDNHDLPATYLTWSGS